MASHINPIEVFLSVAVIATALIPVTANAAGFAILEQSTKRTGTAMAGSGSAAQDASVVWSNPAAMTLMDRQLQVTGSAVLPGFEFTDQGSRQRLPGGSVPLLPAANSREDGGVNAFIPHISWVHPIDDRWHFGVTLNAPFGLSTDYGLDWPGRYQSVKSEIINFNLNPALAYRVSDRLSVGAGVNINYVDAELTNAMDFAAICANFSGGACPNGAFPGQGQFDGFVKNEGDDVSYGINLGMLWEFDSNTRLGISWRSEIDHDIEGTAKFTQPDTLGGFEALGPALGGSLTSTFSNTGSEAELTLPATASASFYHRFSEGPANNFAVLADAVWTGWSSLDELRAEFENPATPASEEPLGWEDVWRVSLGTEYYANDQWTLRAGAAFDESPIPNSQLRSARLPGNDRTWVTLGASLSLSGSSSVDIATAHIFVDDTNINRRGSTGDQLIGEYESDGAVLTFQFNYRW